MFTLRMRACIGQVCLQAGSWNPLSNSADHLDRSPVRHTRNLQRFPSHFEVRGHSPANIVAATNPTFSRSKQYFDGQFSHTIPSETALPESVYPPFDVLTTALQDGSLPVEKTNRSLKRPLPTSTRKSLLVAEIILTSTGTSTSDPT